MAATVTAVGLKASEFSEDHPQVKAVLDKGRSVATSGAHRVRDVVPDAVTDWEWGHNSVDSVQRMLSRTARVGLSPKRVVAKHRKHGHAVVRLADVRALELEQVDRVRRGKLALYPAAAAISGAGAGFVITGGHLIIVAGAGAAAAPGAGAVMGAMAADVAAVLGIAARAVGHVGLLYGYDPEAPQEKIFALSVINAGTAMSSSAKAAAMADISKLTQALFRSATWKVLDTSFVAQLTKQLATRFGVRLTKQGLGKVVPGVGIVAGAGLNYATLEAIVDAADTAYRRRFLLEKYPHLEQQQAQPAYRGDAPDDADEVISIVDELAIAGGPDLRSEDDDRDAFVDDEERDKEA